ncbi:hypothetical protein [Mycobacterium sp. 3519A]|nr:hypothetical protein [Mycobacterium sp. 3519A]
MIKAFACWVRARYPKWATVRGHLALAALCGRDKPQPVSSERVTPS